jgi:hypothetical protein
MKNTKTNGKGKSAKTPKTVTEQVAVAEPIVEQATSTVESTDTILETRADITETADTNTKVCPKCKVSKELNVENFSPSKKGGFGTYCRPCNVENSKAWTDANDALRKTQLLAIKFANAGVPVVKPLASEFKSVPNFVLMTSPHYLMPDGTMVYEETEGAVFVEPRPAQEVYDEIKEASRKAREELEASLKEIHAAEIARRKEERAKAREAKEAEAAKTREADKAKRDEERKAKQLERANEAKLAKEKRDAEREEARKAKAAAQLEAANKARLERERKAAERREAAIATANAARENAIDAANAHALDALRKPSEASEAANA